MSRLGKKSKASCAGLCAASLLVGTVSCGTVDDWELENSQGKAEGISDRWELDQAALKKGVAEKNGNPGSTLQPLQWAKMKNGGSWQDLFKTTLIAGGQEITASTHLFGPMTGKVDMVVPYADQGLLTDAHQSKVLLANGKYATMNGKNVTGDSEVAKLLCDNVGDIGISLKHETQAYPTLDPASVDPKEFKEAMKLYDTHIQMWTCVEDDSGNKRVITLNNPTNYAKAVQATDGSGFSQEGMYGSFGTRAYGNIFLKFNFDQMETGQNFKQAFMDNIRTYAVIFNSISWFPSDYDGNDPLGAWSPGTVKDHVAAAILAVLPESMGSTVIKARSWWAQQLEHYMYCAELGHLAAAAGLMVPLNAKNVVDNPNITFEGKTITQAQWDAFQEVLNTHNSANPNVRADLDNTYFDWRNRMNTGVNHNGIKLSEANVNRNPDAKFSTLKQGNMLRIKMNTAPAELDPFEEYVSRESFDQAGCGQGEDTPTCMAFNPMTIADMVRYFLALFVPRHEVYQATDSATKDQKEIVMGQLQANVLFGMTDGLYDAMGLNTTKAEYIRSQNDGGLGMSSSKADAQILQNEKAKGAIAQAIGIITGCKDSNGDKQADGPCGPSVLTGTYDSYDDFKAALEQDPGYQMAQQIASSGDKPFFVPPSLFHIRAMGQHTGLMNLDYVAHGMHFSLFNPKGEATQPVPEPTRDPITVTPTNADGMKGGKCVGLVGICVNYNESQPGGVCQSKSSTVGSKCLGDPSPDVRCCTEMIPVE